MLKFNMLRNRRIKTLKMMSNLFFGILTWKMLRKKVRILISMKQKHLERILRLVKTNIMTNSNNFCNRNLKTDNN